MFMQIDMPVRSDIPRVACRIIPDDCTLLSASAAVAEDLAATSRFTFELDGVPLKSKPALSVPAGAVQSAFTASLGGVIAKRGQVLTIRSSGDPGPNIEVLATINIEIKVT